MHFIKEITLRIILIIHSTPMDFEDELPCGGYEQEDKHIEKDLEALSLEADGKQPPKKQSCQCEAGCEKQECSKGCSNCSCRVAVEEKKEEKEAQNKGKSKVECKKCKAHPAVLVHKNEAICKECLMKSIEYKTRLALESKIGVRRESRVLVCFSGALNSICLVNILSSLKNRYQKCPLFTELQCIHIQQQSHIPPGYVERFEAETGLKLTVIPIQLAFSQEKTFEQVLQLFKKCKKNSNSVDLLVLLREHLIRKFAIENHFDFVLTGKNGESLAAEIFKYFAKGIGGSASQLTASQPGFFHYPLKQHLQKQLQYYFHSEQLGKLSLLAADDDLGNVVETQLDSCLNSFITTLQDKYSHTAPAIVRTGDRIRSNIENAKQCSWCQIPHDRPERLCQKCIRLSSSLEVSELPGWMQE